MKKIAFTYLLSLLVFHQSSCGQLYYTKNGNVSFYSKSVLQNIEADNNQVISVLDVRTGALQFSLLNTAFQFPKAKMQEDFNENFIESAKYPRSFFKGFIRNLNSLNISKDGTYPVDVDGELTIHGVTKSIKIKGVITVLNQALSAVSSFTILVKDYEIKIPSIVSQKIAEQIQITVNCKYQKK
jgi:hypothetical protein